MLDIRLIRNSPDEVLDALRKRLDSPDLSKILELDGLISTSKSQADELRTKRKEISGQVAQARKRGEDTLALQATSTAIGDEIQEVEVRLEELQSQFQAAMEVLPNLPMPDVPPGGKEANQVVKTWGEKPDLPTDALDHVELERRLGLVDFDRGVKLGGSGSWLYTGLGARLEWGLLNFFIDHHLADGYTFLLPPHMLLDECGYAAGQFPKFRDDVYHIAGDESRGRFLLPTAETAILNVYRDEILDGSELPMKMFAYTPCYRHEAGGYRSEERGTIRGHQFNKVETFQFVSSETGRDSLNEMLRKAEVLLEELGLHYQTSLLSAGDASASMRVTYDVEVWLPSLGIYKEVSSASYAGDYQARRANIRYKTEGQKGSEFVHTLNASGLATSRLFPALVEQYQQADGSVVVPEALRSYVKADVLRPS
jgi:seryl-tRNA synthetase